MPFDGISRVRDAVIADFLGADLHAGGVFP
jgi:hypothetical protein